MSNNQRSPSRGQTPQQSSQGRPTSCSKAGDRKCFEKPLDCNAILRLTIKLLQPQQWLYFSASASRIHLHSCKALRGQLGVFLLGGGGSEAKRHFINEIELKHSITIFSFLFLFQQSSNAVTTISAYLQVIKRLRQAGTVK